MHVFRFILLLVFCSVDYVHAGIKTSLIGEAFSFLSSDYTADPKSFSFIGAHIKSDRTPTDVFKIDVSGRYAPSKNVLSYFNIRELYYSFDTGESSKLHFGRKLQNWSTIDNVWNLGVIQPQFKWNQLNPQNQGLLGFFWDYNSGDYGLTLYASPIFIPDQGAGYELKDGQFQSGNPFFQAPPQNVSFQGQILPIDYDIRRPETNDVVFQSNYGLQFRWGEGKGYFARAAAIRKPSNQLALGYKGVLVTTRVRVDVTPKTYWENDLALDVGYRDDWGYLLLSALSTNPENPDFDSTFNAPKFASGVSWGPQFLYRLDRFQFLAAYLDTTGGEVKDEGPDVSIERASLSQRFLFRQAALMKVAYSDVYDKFVRWDSSFQYKFSPKEKFREIRVKNALTFKAPWSVWVDVILIDTDSSVLSGYENFKDLDQVWLGVSYDL
jgi:hypothetical protein